MSDWYGKKPDKAVDLTTTFLRACLKTGALTPPRGSETERATRLTAYAVLMIVIIGAAMSWAAFLWR